jgi:L-2-hydroxyglutarate oxidase LhgO
MSNSYTESKKPILLIIGAGIVGITIAREAALSKIFKKILIIDKEKKAGFHATSRNSGVIHAGFYYSPDSKKAKFCSKGNSLMRKYILDNSLSFNPCGKVVVSKNDIEDETINILGKRGKENDCDVSVFNSNEILNYEPEAKTNNKFLWSPNTWSASPGEILNCLLKELKEYGVELLLGRKVVEADNKKIHLNNGEKIYYDFLVNAAGGYALSIANLFGIKTKYKILPFKGLYLKSQKKVNKFKAHIYPVPDIKQPFLGIHTTITEDNYLKLGPTAIPVFSPENYNLLDKLDKELTPQILSLQLSLFTKNTFNFRDLAFREFKYLFKKNIIISAQKLTSYNLDQINYDWYSPGIRAQLYDNELQKLENDLVIKNINNSFHLLNSISPAWTCSFETSKYILEKIKKQLF